MNTVLELRLRAASAEMSKPGPGHWRLAHTQFLQAVDQLFADFPPDRQLVQLAFDTATQLYNFAPAMRPAELSALNTAAARLQHVLFQDR